MEFYNPISELGWLYGEWKGEMLVGEEELSAVLQVKPIGSNIVEFNLKTIKGKSETQYEKNILIFDRIQEISKVFSINHEGYMEISELSIKSRNKHTEITSIFSSGINLPPNSKIQKKWQFSKNPKLLNYEVKMGNEGIKVLNAELKFSKYF